MEGNGGEVFDPQDPLLDQGGKPAVMFGGGANKATNVALTTAELYRQVSGVKGGFGHGFGGAGADHVTFGRGGEVADIWATLAQALEELGDFLGWAF